jgi:hypothetical protein
MQDVFCESFPTNEEESMDKVTEIWLNRLDRDYQGLNARLGTIDSKFGALEKDVAEIKGTIKPKELPWGVRFIILPLTQ